MTLLFDQNISFKVAKRIRDVFPRAQHVSDIKLEGSQDIEIWEYSKINNYCIVTYDSDFIDLTTLKGFPPKIIWLRLGNTTTEKIISRLLTDFKLIFDFLESEDTAFLEIK
jgi:predicted nuclease of predicted toxin-antitoxin system